MKLGSIRPLVHIAAWIIGGTLFRLGYRAGGMAGGLVAAGLLVAVYLAVLGLIKAAIPGERAHGKVLEIEAAWWRTAPGFRFSLFAAVVWAIGAFFVQDSYDRSWQLVVFPAAGILAVYFGFRVLVAGPDPERYAARIVHHVESAERAQAPTNAARSVVGTVEAESAVSVMTPAQRKQAMDALIGKMK